MRRCSWRLRGSLPARPPLPRSWRGVLFVLVDGSGAGVGWLVLRATEPTLALESSRKRAN